MRFAFLLALAGVSFGAFALFLHDGTTFMVAFRGAENEHPSGGTTLAASGDAIPSGESDANRVALPEDIPPQTPLPNPPSVIKAVYATSWSAGSARKTRYFIDLLRNTELNALVVDIKDFSGKIAYQTGREEVARYGAEERRIPKINTFIKQLHDEGIYAIARIAVFQDSFLPSVRPDLAVRDKTGNVWRDHKGLSWLDPAGKEVWDYHVALAKDALHRGFDEINFDYIRFPSDGDLEAMSFPFWNASTTRRGTIAEFFRYVRDALSGARISADIFGLATVDLGDLGIGQRLEDALPSFDAVAPMVYPSHYAHGFIGYQNPAAYPYEVVKYSLVVAADRVRQFTAANGTTTPLGLLRPWIQDFDLGAVYDAEKVAAQIRAAEEAGAVGYMVWSPANVYTEAAFRKEFP